MNNMSPEVNGNPPSVTRRKKNRDRRPTNANSFEPNMSSCSYFPMDSIHCPNINFPDPSTPYYPFVNYTNPTEPLSLPVYPFNYPSYTTCPSGFLGGMKSVSQSMGNFNNDISEYMSLPVVNQDQADEAHSRRRFSDPGLPNESDSSSNSFEDKIIQKLTQQISSLKENNRQLTREVMEMRFEINMLKQQQSYRHLNKEYEPGMLADVIREVRDAARVREDALLARVKHIIEEKQLSMNHMHLVSEKNVYNDRISKLEDQLKNLTINNNISKHEDLPLNNSTIVPSVEDNINAERQVRELEREVLELRRELQVRRAKKEDPDQKNAQLDKRLSYIQKRDNTDNVSISDMSEDGKTSSADSLSTTSSSFTTVHHPRVVLSGPVTNL